MRFQLVSQWWERMGYVVLLHPAVDPNHGEGLGWVKVTPDRANQVLQAQAEKGR